MRTRAYRRWIRSVKAWRRINEDRAQHGQSRDCPCWDESDMQTWGRTFARFADTPRLCSCWMCANPRKFGHLTLQERRAAIDGHSD